MDMQLAGKRVLVTGGSKGIGLAVARWFASEGCRVVLVARAPDTLDKAAASLRDETGAVVSTLAFDLSAPGSAEQVAAIHPDIDILVNNAGDIPGGTLEQIDEAKWRAAWDLKVFGYINLSRAYFTRMKNRGGGVILNIIGSAGDILNPGYIAGAVGNAALNAFTKSLGSDSVDHGIRVVGINPGPVNTERHVRLAKTRASQEFGDESRWQELNTRMAMGRPASVDEIAATAVMLCSPLSAYTSGTVISIDAGASVRR